VAHVTVNSTVPRVVYAGPGRTFAVPFSLPGGSALRVFSAGALCALASSPTNDREFSFAGIKDDGGFRGGTITFGADTAGPVIVERDVPLERTADFPYPSSLLDILALNTEFDTFLWMLQQVESDGRLAVRVDPSSPETAGFILPPPAQRANRVFAFGGAGELALISGLDRSGDTVTAEGGSTGRLLAGHLSEWANPRDFGGVGNGLDDDTPAIQAAFDRAAATGGHVLIGRGTWRITNTVKLSHLAAGLTMRGTILYAGPQDRGAVEIGTLGGPRASQRNYRGLAARSSVQSTWANERNIGFLLHNFDACKVEILLADGFNIGVRTNGSGTAATPAGFEDTDITLGRLSNNRIGLDIWCSAPGPYAWNNSVRYHGGHFAVAGATNPTISRYGVRLGREPGGYALHNAHLFHGPAFELQNGYQTGGPGSAVDAIPFLNLTAGRAVIARGIRMEGCSPFVAEHRNAGVNSDVPARVDAQDCIYEVIYASNGAQPRIGGLPQGDSYLVDVRYGVGCNRAGGTVIRQAQAAAAARCTRLVADLPSARAAAFQWRPLLSNPEVGFESMAVLSSNTAGTTLASLAFPGLDNFTAVGDGVRFPTSRAIGWVVRTDTCREFEVAFDGNRCRPFVMIFDAAENVITPTLVTDPDGARTAASVVPPLPPGTFDPDPDPNRSDYDTDPDLTEQPGGTTVPDPAGPVVLFSNSGALYNSVAKWWVSGAEPSDFTTSRLQRITLPTAAKFAIIGITSLGTESGDADGDGVGGETHVLRSARLFCPPEFAPAVIFGGARVWGTREVSGSATFDPPSLANGAATVSINTGRSSGLVAVPGVRPGDFIQVGWIPGSGFQTGGFIFHGAVGATAELGGSSASELVTVTCHNLTGGTNDLPSGTAFVRGLKQRF